MGCEFVKFLPKKGDALIWHADRVHGGAQDVAHPHCDRIRDPESGASVCYVGR